MLIVKGEEIVHALHVLQFADAVSCAMCMMTKGPEMCIENSLRMFPVVPRASSTAVSWLNVCGNSFTNSSLSGASVATLH